MNLLLRAEIIRHVLANFGVIPSDFVDLNKSNSLLNKEFLISEKLSFEDEDGLDIYNKIWGCQISADIQEIKVLLGDCTQEKDYPEYAMIVQLKNAPAYGLYLSFKESYSDASSNYCFMAYSLDSINWLECNTFLQATFLTGMEQLKEIGYSWNKITNYQSQYNSLLSFIKYHSVYGDLNEGQEM